MRAFANDKGADLDKREGFDGNQNHTEGILATKEILFEIDARIQMGSMLEDGRDAQNTTANAAALLSLSSSLEE